MPRIDLQLPYTTEAPSSIFNHSSSNHVHDHYAQRKIYICDSCTEAVIIGCLLSALSTNRGLYSGMIYFFPSETP
jgi:hypothetical protein